MLRVTVEDTETGEGSTAEIQDGDYVLICAEPCHRATGPAFRSTPTAPTSSPSRVTARTRPPEVPVTEPESHIVTELTDPNAPTSADDVDDDTANDEYDVGHLYDRCWTCGRDDRPERAPDGATMTDLVKQLTQLRQYSSTLQANLDEAHRMLAALGFTHSGLATLAPPPRPLTPLSK